MNPHKWMGTGFDLSAYFVKDPQHLIRVMGTNPSYLRTSRDAEVNNFRDWGIPLGRRFRSLKLWFLMMEHGVEGIQTRIRRDIAMAGWLAAQVDAAPNWQRVAPAPLQTVCMRHVPPKLVGDETALALHNQAIADTINASGHQYLATSILKDQKIIRVSVGAMYTELRHIEKLWEALQVCAVEP